MLEVSEWGGGPHEGSDRKLAAGIQRTGSTPGGKTYAPETEETGSQTRRQLLEKLAGLAGCRQYPAAPIPKSEEP